MCTTLNELSDVLVRMRTTNTAAINIHVHADGRGSDAVELEICMRITRGGAHYAFLKFYSLGCLLFQDQPIILST